MNEDNEGSGIWTHWDDSPLDYKPAWDYKRQPDNWIRPKGGILDTITMIIFFVVDFSAFG